MAFEYKTLQDFINSVQNGRIVEQAIRLNQNFDYPFVMIQANEQELKNYINKLHFMRKTMKFYEKNYYGAINSLNCYVTVLNCPSQYLAFQSMLNQAKKCLNNAPINRKIAKTGSSAYQCLRYCIRGVGPKTASKIVNTLDLNTISDVANVTFDDLLAVDGIGKNTAKKIINEINGG